MTTTRCLPVALAIALLAKASALADPVIPNLIAYWDFNQTGGTTLPDVVGGYDGTLADLGDDSWSDASWVESSLGLGNALEFKGGWVEIGQLSQDNPMNVGGSLTIAAWIKPHSMGYETGTGRIFNHRTHSSSHGGYEFYLRSTGRLALIGVDGTGTYVDTSNNAVEYGSAAPWQHVAMTLSDVYQVGGNDRTDLSFYVNGEQLHTQTVSPPLAITGGTDPTLLLGDSTAYGDPSPGSRRFDGLMDDVGVWSEALTPTHVATIHSVGQHRALGYDLGQAHELFEVHADGEGSATIGGRQWTYATGLSTDPDDLGRVVVADGRYTIPLDSSGAGVAAQSDLVAYWRFDEVSDDTVFDSSASGLDGTLKGSGDNRPTLVDGKFGSALRFDRSNSEYVEIGSDNVVTQLAGATTYSFWTRLPGEGSGSSGFISIAKDNNNRWYLDDDNRRGRARMWQVGGGATSGSQIQTAAELLTYGDGTWHHVVVTDDGSGSDGTNIYIDGVLRATADSFDYSGLPDDSVMRLGTRFVSSVEYLGGDLDDFGIWRTGLTAPQARALYSLGDHADIRHDLGQVQELLDAHDAGIGRSVRHGSLQWDSATGIRTPGAEPGQVVKADGRYVIALDDAGTGFAANAELIAHWRFDEASGDVAYDSAGTNHGTLQGSGNNSPEWVDGKFGTALRFSGGATAEHVLIGGDNVVTDLSGPKTFSFWTRLPELDASPRGRFIGIDSDESNRWYLDDRNADGRVRVWQTGGATQGSPLFQTDPGLLTYGEDIWHHVAVADDGSGADGVRVYVDGNYIDTYDSFDYSGLAGDPILRLGARLTADGPDYMKGDLDDVGVWRVALSEPQVKALYNVGRHPDLGYDLGQGQQLFNMHHDQRGGARLNGHYWIYGAGLSSDPDDLGQVLQDGGRYYLSLDGDGTGVMTPGKLLAHWTFNDGEGSVVTDSMGRVDGTLVGSGGSTGEWIADGVLGGALRLDSSRNQYVLAGSDNLVTNLPGEKTIAFWVRMEDGSSTSNGFIGIDDGTRDNRWYIDSGGRDATDVRSYKEFAGSEGNLFRATGALEYGRWHHVVVTDDGSGDEGTTVFVDGEQVLMPNSFEFADLPPDSLLRLGAARHGYGLQYLEGDLDDFGIWSVALTEPQVSGLHQFALDPALGYDLGMVQQLFDHHELGLGGGELNLDGFWRWEYTDGLDTGPGLLTEQNGRYFFQLDAAGTGLTAIPEPGTIALLGMALIALLPRRRRR